MNLHLLYNSRTRNRHDKSNSLGNMAKGKKYITSTIFIILHGPEEETTFSVCVVVPGQAGHLNSTQIRLRKLCPQTQCHVIKSGHILDLYSTYLPPL